MCHMQIAKFELHMHTAFRYLQKIITHDLRVHSCHIVQVNNRYEKSIFQVSAVKNRSPERLNYVNVKGKILLTFSDISNSDPESESCIILDNASSRVYLEAILSNAVVCLDQIIRIVTKM